MSDNVVVHIVDDDEALSDSTKMLLEAAGFACATYSSARAFLDAAHTARGCALVDVRMPEMDGIALLRALRTRRADLPVIIITGVADVPLAVQAMKEGAVDFIEKPTPRDALTGAVRRALDAVRPTEIGGAERQEALGRLNQLTQREREVLELLVSGNANKAVAHKLGISPRTVEIHRSRLMEKTGAGSLAGLVRLALAGGIHG